MHHVIILGAGFLGLNAAKALAGDKRVRVTLIDRSNYHLFQPLLYQVASAGLSPSDIATPIRSLFSGKKNIETYKAEVRRIDPDAGQVVTDIGTFGYDSLVVGLGAKHFYFGNEHWEEYAPGLKTIEQATEIRRRILESFERAEAATDTAEKMKHLSFVVVGGGSTGVELAGALGELSRFVFVRDFRHIDPKLARIILIEAGERILPAFSPELAARAVRDLETLGVQVWTSRKVTGVDPDGVDIGEERIQAGTVLWAAGIAASPLNRCLSPDLDRMGRTPVQPDLSLKDRPEIFAGGDQAHFEDERYGTLPANAPVALQQGRHIAANILRDLDGRDRQPFRYFDKGQLATIGRKRAILERGRLKLSGFLAWWAWLFVHIYYLLGFKNKLFVLAHWAYSYLTYRKGARLIVNKEWRFYKSAHSPERDGSD